MRLRVVGMLSVAASILGCPPAWAANQTVMATPQDSFVASQVTIGPGERVTWMNAGGNHNVHFDDNTFVMPSAPSPSLWSVSHQFAQAGTYRYYCDAHGGPGGSGMSGTVLVTTSGGGSSPLPPPPGPGGASPAPDNAKPTTTITAPSTQDVRKLYVRASMSEAGILRAVGRVNVPGGVARIHKFRPVSRTVGPNTVVKLRLKLSRKSLRTVRRALKRKRLRARITVTARDNAGNAAARTRTVRLER